MVWFQDEDIPLVNTELGLTPLWNLGNRTRFPSCIVYSNQEVISRKHCLLCLFIAMETQLSTAFFVQSTLLLPTCLRHSQHDSYDTFLLNDAGNQEETRHQADHALLQSLVIRLLSLRSKGVNYINPVIHSMIKTIKHKLSELISQSKPFNFLLNPILKAEVAFTLLSIYSVILPNFRSSSWM